jgi:hypothetical protein
MIAVTVHTTGINWDGLLANTASILVIVALFAGLIARSVNRSVTDSVRKVITSDVTPTLERLEAALSAHDTRIARLEGIEQGKRYALDAAGVTTSPPTAQVGRGR